MYGYVLSSPPNHVDPTGTESGGLGLGLRMAAGQASLRDHTASATITTNIAFKNCSAATENRIRSALGESAAMIENLLRVGAPGLKSNTRSGKYIGEPTTDQANQLLRCKCEVYDAFFAVNVESCMRGQNARQQLIDNNFRKILNVLKNGPLTFECFTTVPQGWAKTWPGTGPQPLGCCEQYDAAGKLTREAIRVNQDSCSYKEIRSYTPFDRVPNAELPGLLIHEVSHLDRACNTNPRGIPEFSEEVYRKHIGTDNWTWWISDSALEKIRKTSGILNADSYGRAADRYKGCAADVVQEGPEPDVESRLPWN